MSEETASQTWGKMRSHGPDAVPGLVLVFSGTQPQLAAVAVRSEPLLLGRDDILGVTLDDTCLSRRHAQVSFEGGRFRIRDLDSRNGTFIDGHRLRGELETMRALLRVGDTILLVTDDIRPFERAAIERDEGAIVGPTLRPVWKAIADAAKSGDVLHVSGEAGTGKELAARHFHRSSGRGLRPFSAVSCASIPSSLAERVLFGARRGAYSDVDSDGYVQGADGGTLFLDEVADLDLNVQAKLLRTLEERQVVAFGASMGSPVDVRICSATHRDLSSEVGRGSFRHDLYTRIGLPTVKIPPLRARREDVPWLLQSIAGREPTHPKLHASLVEAVLLRPWPGNVRELERRISEAARTAHAQGEKQVRAVHLAPTAGQLTDPVLGTKSTPPSEPSREGREEPYSRESIERALADTGGNVTAAAVALGLHRTQLRRLIARFKIPRTEAAGR